MNYYQHKSGGFTLIEILIGIGILSGIVAVISIFSFDIFSLQLFLGDTFIIQQEINLTLTNMAIEVRAMGPSANGSYPIESASSKSLAFYSDVDGDSVFERVRYFVSGSSLKRGIIEPTGNPAIYVSTDEVSKDVVSNVVLLSTASQSLFVYYEQDYTGNQPAMSHPININRVRLIRATITADRTPQDLRGRVDYSTTMLIRNLHNVK